MASRVYAPIIAHIRLRLVPLFLLRLPKRKYGTPAKKEILVLDLRPSVQQGVD